MTQRKVKSPESIALDLGLIAGSVESLISELERHGEMPWTAVGAEHVRDRLASIELILAEARMEAERARWHAEMYGTITRKSKWVLTIPVSDRGLFQERHEEAVIEAVRGYAFPEVWGYVAEPESIFRLEFEVEANERETCEYVEEVRSAVISWCPFGYEIERIKPA